MGLFEQFIIMLGDMFFSLQNHARDVLIGNAVNLNSVWTAIRGITDAVILPLASQILVICILLELVQVAQRFDKVSFERITMLLAKFVIAQMALVIAPDLLRGIFETANSLISNVESNSALSSSGTIAEIPAAWREMASNFGSMGILDKFQAIIPLIIMGIALLVCGVTLVIAAYSRIFEVMVYALISPIPLAFLPIGSGDGGGFSPITMGFIKNFTAVCLQGVMMMACIQVFMQLGISISLGGVGDNFKFGEMMGMIIITIALVSAVKASGGWAKKALGVAG